MELSDREIASLIWLGVIVLVYLLVPSLRRQVGPSFVDVLKHFFVWRIQVVLLVYLAYAVALVWLAWLLGLWSVDLLKDTVIIVFGGGLGTLFTAFKIESASALLRSTVKETLGLAALAAFFVGLSSFSLVAELILQPVVVFFVVLGAFAKTQENGKAVARICSFLVAVYGVVVFVWAITQVFRPETDVNEALSTFALSLWLPVALAPFMYVAALIMKLGVIFTHPKALSRRRLGLPIKLAIIIGLRARLSLAFQFSAQWSNRLKDVTSTKQVRALLRRYRDMTSEQRRQGPDEEAMAIIYPQRREWTK